ncbi:MAG: hypothetical protein HUU55_04855 [Myxococcales bacterium]|nr:hypothetical protein [Myxococcales bacterium]
MTETQQSEPFWEAFSPDAAASVLLDETVPTVTPDVWSTLFNRYREAALGPAIGEWITLDSPPGIALAARALARDAAPNTTAIEAVVARLLPLGSVIRREQGEFVTRSLARLVPEWLLTPESPSIFERALTESADLFYVPRWVYPWEFLQKWTTADSVGRTAAQRALSHQLKLLSEQGDPFWPLVALSLLGKPEDSVVVARWVMALDPLEPAFVVIAADALARFDDEGLDTALHLWSHPDPLRAATGVMAVGLSGHPDARKLLEEYFLTRPDLQPLVADAWAWGANNGNLTEFFRLLRRAHPAMRSDVREAALLFMDPLRRPPPRLHRDWLMRFLPPLLDEHEPWPGQTQMPALLALMAESEMKKRRQKMEAVERAFSAENLEELMAEISDPPVDTFENGDLMYVQATGIPVVFEQLGTFFVEQLALVKAYALGAGGAPLGVVALNVWMQAVAHLQEDGSEENQPIVAAQRMLISTLRWAHDRGADTLADCEVLLGAMIERTLSWAVDSADEGAQMRRDIEREATNIAETLSA